MKDKKIIIDDINVSECKCYNPNIKMDCLLYPLQPDACKNNPNCHYKLYKRKEQECEELKDKLNCCFCNPHIELNDIEKQRKCVEVTECFRRQLDQLKKENETYKSSIVANLDKNISKRYRELLEENDQLKAENEELKKSVLQECPNCGEEYLNYKGAALYFENSDLKQTLAEIKEICKTNVCKHCYSKFKVDDNYCKSRKNCDCYNILQKINEVENEQNSAI